MKASDGITELTQVEFVDLDGDPHVPKYAAPKLKTVAERPDYHAGWAVVGHRSGTIAEAKTRHEEALAQWQAAHDGGMARSEWPGQWDEAAWIRKQKPRRIHKPFAIRSAAEQFAAMAIREGIGACGILGV